VSLRALACLIALALPASAAAAALAALRRLVARDDRAAVEHWLAVKTGVASAVFSGSAWKSPTAGARDREEAGRASAPAGAGGSYRLDTVAARALVEETIAGVGWRLG